MVQLNSKNRKTLEALFEIPTRSNVRWTDFESLLTSLGAVTTEGRGARVRVLLNNCEAVFHRPHPRPDMNKGAVGSAREFLRRGGVEPQLPKDSVTRVMSTHRCKLCVGMSQFRGHEADTWADAELGCELGASIQAHFQGCKFTLRGLADIHLVCRESEEDTGLTACAATGRGYAFKGARCARTLERAAFRGIEKGSGRRASSKKFDGLRRVLLISALSTIATASVLLP